MSRNPVRIINDHRTQTSMFCHNWNGLTKAQYYLFRGRWALDYSGLPEIYQHLCEYAVNKSVKERWKMPKGRSYPQEFVRLALHEYRNPLQFMTIQPKDRDPKNKTQVIQARRAAFLGMKRQTFYGWKGKYEDIYQQLESELTTAFQKIYQNQVEFTD